MSRFLKRVLWEPKNSHTARPRWDTLRHCIKCIFHVSLGLLFGIFFAPITICRVARCCRPVLAETIVGCAVCCQQALQYQNQISWQSRNSRMPSPRPLHWNCMHLLAGLGDAWGAAPPPINPRESCIKELGSHLLQVTLAYVNIDPQLSCCWT
jgi:hypothetical protein